MVDSHQLVIGIMDDSPDGLVLMKELAASVALYLGLDEASVTHKATQDRREAERIAASGECQLLLTDLMWPAERQAQWRQGLAIAEMAKTANPRSVVVVITGKQEQERDFRTEARARGADTALTWDEAFGSGKMQSARDLAHLLAPGVSSLILGVESSARSTVGLIGLDTVAYSEQDDDTQLAIVRSFLTYTRESWQEASTPLARPVILFTGDGLIFGIVGEEGPRLALDVAVKVWKKLNSLAKYETRIAVHAGPVNVVTLSNGSLQLLGHSVNWLCRAMNATANGALSVTDEYRSTVLQGGREIVDGLTFARRETTAKHDRVLIFHEAVGAGEGTK